MCLCVYVRAAIRRESERGRLSGGAAVAGVRRGPSAVPAARRSVTSRRRRQRLRRHRDHRRKPSHAGALSARMIDDQTVMPNTHRRRDSTRQLRRVGGVYWA